MTRLIFNKAADIDLECYDTPEHYDELMVSVNEGESRAWAVYNNFVELFDTVCGSIAVAFVIITLDIFVFFIAAAMYIMEVLLNIKKNKNGSEMYDKTVPHHRQINYANRIFFVKNYAKDIKLTGISKLMFSKIDTAAKELFGIYRHYGTKAVIYNCISSFLKMITGELGVMTYMAYRVLVENTYTFGVMVALWNGYGAMKGSIGSYIDRFNDFHNHSIYIDKFLDFMNYENDIKQNQSLKLSDNDGISIEFRDVCFGYRGNEHIVLDELNLSIDSGEHTAIVGPNGAGKSTLIKLLLRLYEPDSGDIFVNSVNIKDYDLAYYRKNIFAALTQDFQIYAASIAENVKMDSVDYENESFGIANALNTTGIGQKINHIKAQYSREFYDDGVVLSGGERQKLALSRMIYNEKSCILLDEPSSALDAEAEYDMNKFMFDYIKNKTAVIISHRLSTTRMADRIFLIDKGKVSEKGSHDELMKLNGVYAKMFDAQGKRYM
jgi:ATP-binding cassette subfamily B protein